MQVAEVLSDLTSLYVCDSEAAVNLVSSHRRHNEAQTKLNKDAQRPNVTRKSSGIDTKGDIDLQRALDLSTLHNEMKEKHGKGAEMDQILEEARRKVAAVYRQISMHA